MTCVNNLDPGFNKTDPSTGNIDPGFNKIDPSIGNIDPGFNKEMPECPPTEGLVPDGGIVFSIRFGDVLDIGRFIDVFAGSSQETAESQAMMDKAKAFRKDADKFADRAACLESKVPALASGVSAEQADLTCEVQAECANETEEDCTAKTMEMLEQNKGDIGKQSAILEGHRVGTVISQQKILSDALDALDAAEIILQDKQLLPFGAHNHDYFPHFPFGGDLPDLGGLILRDSQKRIGGDLGDSFEYFRHDEEEVRE